MTQVIAILDSDEGHIVHVVTDDPDLTFRVVDVSLESIEQVIGPYDPEVTQTVYYPNAAVLTYLRERGAIPPKQKPGESGEASWETEEIRRWLLHDVHFATSMREALTKAQAVGAGRGTREEAIAALPSCMQEEAPTVLHLSFAQRKGSDVSRIDWEALLDLLLVAQKKEEEDA